MSSTTSDKKCGGGPTMRPRQSATPSQCVDGKRHRWEYLSSGITGGSLIEQKWCSQCGSYTEFYRVNGKNSRAMENGKPFIQIPKVSK